jgi:simple sugar transport system substrate-binding protein
MRRAVILAVLALAAMLALAACGKEKTVREPDLVATTATGDQAATAGRRQSTTGEAGVRIAVVTHGQASSSFWAIVRNGIDQARRQMDVRISYSAPDVYSVPRMRALIDRAVASRPDALVVSIPDAQLGGAIRRAVRAGIPVVSINSGIDLFRRFGVLAHVGQPEDRAGAAAGRRMAAAGVRRALCINHEAGNIGLEQRCDGFTREIRRAGGTVRVVGVDVNDPTTPRRIAGSIDSARADGVLTLNGTAAAAALEASRMVRPRKVQLGTFDLSPEVLEAVRNGRMRFAIDQQAFLQGYLPIVLLTQRVRYGLFPAEGEVIPTGPSFVTRATAAQAIRLSNRSIR